MRYYTTEVEIAVLNPAAGDGILIIEAPADMVVKIIRAVLYNLDNDTHEMLHAGFFKVNTKGPLAGDSTPAIQKHDNGDQTSTVTTYGAGNAGMTTEPTSWQEPFDSQGFSNLNGYEYNPPLVSLDGGPILSPNELAGIRLMTVPSTGFQAKALIEFAEVGG